jgi:phosphatidylinositol alpha-1,6-mannosyltransferase
MNERLGVPYGILVHGGDLLGLQHKIHQSRVKRSTAKSLLSSAAVIIANSKWTRDLCHVVLGELGLDDHEGRVRIVPLGTDPALFRPAVATDAIRGRYGLDRGLWLLTVARLVPHKGVDVTLQALAGLAQDHPDLRYAVVGRGDHQPALEALARELGVKDRVRFLTEVTDADLPAIYNAADLYVGVSRQAGIDVEGFGISLLEASASGLAVVAGRSGGIPDAVQDGETGVLVDSENPRAVAAGISALLADPARRTRLGEQGRRAVVERYNWDRVVADFMAIAGEFTAPGAAPARR